MSDDLDRAQLEEERSLERAMKLRKPDGPPFTGCCHNCDEPLLHPKRFCDLDCLNDYEKRKRHEKQNPNCD